MQELLHRIEQTAKEKHKHLIVCEGWEERSLKAAAYICNRDIGGVTLLGETEQIHQQARSLGLDITSATIIDPRCAAIRTELVNELVDARKHKGMTPGQAEELLLDVNYFACLLARINRADAVAGSAICPTAALMRPALQLLRQNGALVSETALVQYRERTYFIADLSNNIAPDADSLAAIAVNAGDVAAMFGVQPRIALLSFSTKGSGGDHPCLQKIRHAVALVKERRPEFLVDGELQLDAAVSPEAAQTKCPESPLRGAANVLVFPDLNSANIFGHGLLLCPDVRFSFNLLRGLHKPVAILGRSVGEELVKNMMLAALAQ